MIGHKSYLPSLLGCLIGITLLLVTPALVSGQVPIISTEKPKLEVSQEPSPQPSNPNISPASLEPEIKTAGAVKPEMVKESAEAPKAEPAPKAELAPTSKAAEPAACPVTARRIKADIVALPQPIMLNRLGAAVPDGLVFALASDTKDGYLRAGKRPRPIVLRANVGDCLEITFKNAIPTDKFGNTTRPGASIGTTEVSLHVQGMEWVPGSQDDASFVGKNNSSLASVDPHGPDFPPSKLLYTLHANREGTFLLYTTGDSSTQGLQLMRGLFGALNVEPAGKNWQSEWYRSQVTGEDLQLATTGLTSDGHPIINYNAVYPAGHERAGVPILKMLDADNNIVHTDLTAIITGPNAGRFPGTTGTDKPEPPCNAEGNPALGPVNGSGDPIFCANPASPDRKQPYREVTTIYHEMMNAVTAQAFPVFTDPIMITTLAGGKDAFAINYGTGGISAEIYANRLGLGPMGGCVDCKFEEFFLSAWPVGDPAMLVDYPANSNNLATQPRNPATNLNFAPPCATTIDFEGSGGNPPNANCANARNPLNGFPYTLKPLVKATKALFPDDPSNVYHSYINDHLKFRILHGGTGVSHVHHQHAHQWLQSPNSDQGAYLDSQMISPGAAYTLEMVYNGSGNRNKVVGDSIFHCHFYPHFASGMWAMWRTHDTFESGTFVFPKNSPKAGQVVPGSRALPDGEIVTGVPTPAVVPMPTLPMAPLPGYAQIQTNVKVHGAQTTTGGQVVIGGTCQNNKINGLTVVGGCTNGQTINGTVIKSEFDGANMTGQFKPSTGNKIENPGFPYFIPGIAGSRPPHPPLDFAPDGSGGFLDGGLPRHLVAGGSIGNEQHTAFDWSKDFATINAVSLPEDGTAVEKAAIAFFSERCYPSFFPNGTAGSCPSSISTAPQSTLNTPPSGFVLNGLPLGPQPGAPFADPAIDDNGNAVNIDPVTKKQRTRRYKAAAIQMNIVLNKQALGWHYPQARVLTLWDDVKPSIDFSLGKPGRPPEPLFFRGNSGDIIEYWHTNLVPNYYIVDDFQVRTPTDILGQHIHLVKFDVTASDGAGNGFNYEDGTFSPDEVREMIHAINDSPTKGFVNAPNKPLKAKAPPTEICGVPNPPAQCASQWVGAQTTIQRWYLDPLNDNSNEDRTLRTVFTHDHFGPSTHQQIGLYAGLVVEPTDSTWTSNDGLTTFGSRSDGGPTSWEARIITKNQADSYREFLLEFQDFQLAYQVNQLPGQLPAKFPNPSFPPNPDHSQGYRDFPYALGAPSTPQIISTGGIGSHSVNYRNEPVPWRAQLLSPGGNGDLSNAFDSGSDITGSILKNDPIRKGDPFTPLMRAYQGDKVQLRLLVGAHMFAHQFNLNGPTWFAEPSWKNSGYRSAQPMGLSEHFELLFNVPFTSRKNRDGIDHLKCPDGQSTGFCIDYLYSPSFDENGIANGMWGLFRSYDPTLPANGLKELPNNLLGPSAKVNYATCPSPDKAPPKTFNITAVTAQKALALRSPTPEDKTKGQIVFNDRDGGNPNNQLRARLGIMYVRSEDLDNNGRLKAGVPVEPLILRANAGDCITVNLTNAIDSTSDIFGQTFTYQNPLTGAVAPAFSVPAASQLVGLHPQLLSYDAADSTGYNVGYNRLVTNGKTQIAFFDPNNPARQTRQYKWYAGTIERKGNTPDFDHVPVEFGALNLFPSDPLFQSSNALFGQMIIEPKDSTWTCDAQDGSGNSIQVSCDPFNLDPAKVKNYTRASATVTPSGKPKFREFAVMISDAIRISQNNSSAVNYRTEPSSFRFAGSTTTDFSCMLSNQLVNGDPKTPIFTAKVGETARFRFTHPFGTGTSQVIGLHGHNWQRNPYSNNSKDIGDNSLSQWLGSRDNHGSSDHFELIVSKAGGENAKAGDYLYTTYLPQQATLGSWGLFRVGTDGTPPIQNGACPKPPVPPKALIPPAPEPKKQPDLDILIRQPASKDREP